MPRVFWHLLKVHQPRAGCVVAVNGSGGRRRPVPPYPFARAVPRKDHTLGGFHSRRLLSHSAGG